LGNAETEQTFLKRLQEPSMITRWSGRIESIQNFSSFSIL